MFQRSLLALAATSALFMFGANALACSTIIIGKDVSKTGTTIVGHNEDNGGRVIAQQYWVPAQTHKAGEMIKFEEKAAPIPQVEKTLGFYWTQTFDPKGASFSDGFVNEKGVTIVSNACSQIFPENKEEVKDGGIGYGIRRIMAERATSARDAIKIATELLAKYGYFSNGRTYTIADPNEVWQLAIHQGNKWVARRVKDNEVVYIPNNFMMNKVDVTDKDNVMVSPGLVEKAIKDGKYKPAVEGQWTDFNFRVAYQPAKLRDAHYNFSRNQIAWKKITGKTFNSADEFPYSVVADRKFGVDDVKDILRSDSKEDGAKGDWYHTKGFGISRPTTHESVVYVMDENPLFIQAYKTLARPSETPYVPLYPLAKPAKATAFLTWEEATKQHFHAKPESFSYDADWPVWAFINTANAVEYMHPAYKKNFREVKSLEKELNAPISEELKTAKELAKISPEKALNWLHAKNVEKFEKAQEEMAETFAKLTPHEVLVLADAIDSKGDETVNIAILSDKKLKAEDINDSQTVAGPGRSSVGAKVTLSSLAKPTASEVKDVNGDGIKDKVLSFKAKEIAKDMLPGAVYDVWVYSEAKGKPVTGFGTALIK